jgi:hypothetical protein
MMSVLGLWVPPSPLFFVSVDSKLVMGCNRVSVDSARVEVVCFVGDAGRSVSADSKGFKAVCFDTDPRRLGSVDSTRVGGAFPVSAESKGVRHGDQAPELKKRRARGSEVVIPPEQFVSI